MNQLLAAIALVLSHTVFCFQMIEADQYNQELSEGVNVSQIGSVSFIGDIESGDSINFNIKVLFPGAYEIVYVVSNQETDSSFSVTKDGSISKAHTDLQVPMTIKPSDWAIVQSSTHFDAGDHDITIHALKGKWSLKKLFVINAQERENSKGQLIGYPQINEDESSFRFSGLNVGVEDLFCKKLKFNASMGTEEDCVNGRPTGYFSEERKDQTIKPFIEKTWDRLGSLNIDIANYNTSSSMPIGVCSVSLEKDCGLPCADGRKYGDKWSESFPWGSQRWACGPDQKKQFLAASCKRGYSLVEKSDQVVCEPASCGGTPHGSIRTTTGNGGTITQKCSYGELIFQSIRCSSGLVPNRNRPDTCIQSCGNNSQLGDFRDYEKVLWEGRHVGYRQESCELGGKWRRGNHIRCNVHHGYEATPDRQSCRPSMCPNFGDHGTIKQNRLEYEYKKISLRKLNYNPELNNNYQWELKFQCTYKRKLCQYGLIYNQTGTYVTTHKYVRDFGLNRFLCGNKKYRRKAHYTFD